MTVRFMPRACRNDASRPAGQAALDGIAIGDGGWQVHSHLRTACRQLPVAAATLSGVQSSWMLPLLLLLPTLKRTLRAEPVLFLPVLELGWLEAESGGCKEQRSRTMSRRSTRLSEPIQSSVHNLLFGWQQLSLRSEQLKADERRSRRAAPFRHSGDISVNSRRVSQWCHSKVTSCAEHANEPNRLARSFWWSCPDATRLRSSWWQDSAE